MLDGIRERLPRSPAVIGLLVPLAALIYSGGVLRTRGRVSFREACGGAR